MGRLLIPLPASDFDPTEAAVSWKVLTDSGHRVSFATPTGAPSAADPSMITGVGLDPWGWAPGFQHLVAMGRILRADDAGRNAYAAMNVSTEFNTPGHWDDIDVTAFDGLLLPGGHHAPGMRPYLESRILQQVVVDAFRGETPVAAICHGVLLVARSIDSETDLSVLHGRKTTSLTWHQESLAGPSDYVDIDPSDPDARIKNDGRHRDSLEDKRPAHVVIDGNFVSARWPGDAHTFAKRFGAVVDRAA